MARRHFGYRQLSLTLSLVTTLTVGTWLTPAWAGDPFRQAKPHAIGSKTEATFNAIFRDGNYTQAKQLAQEATQREPNEPLAFAIAASLAYSDEDWAAMKTAADKTLATAEKLKATDPLRGNLYVAVGNFLVGAYEFKTSGPLSAINKLPTVFDSLEVAEKIDPKDPELNLMKGYLDLILSISLPFAKPEQAIDKFEKYAAPDFVVDRALGNAYRDLKQYDKALDYINSALKATPDNPEIQYFKGQLLRSQGRLNKDMTKLKEALTYFELANKKFDQLPKNVQISLSHERMSVQAEMEKLAQNPNIDKL